MRLERSDLELEVVIRRIEDGEIDLQPDFQRGEVWNEERQRRLIDTVLRDWYIPPVHVISEPDTSFDLVLDGQQRLAALRRFFSDELRVHGHLDPQDPDIQKLDGMVYTELPEGAQRRVRRFPLSVVTLSEYEPEEPYELFFRLNQHIALTPPEKRNALYGKARDQVKDVVNHLTSTGLLDRTVVGFANSRLAYDDVLARVALVLEHGTLRTPHSNRSIEAFYREAEFSGPVLETVVASAETFLRCAREVGPRLNKATLFSWLVFARTLLAMQEQLEPQFVWEFEEARRAAKRHRGEADLPPFVFVYNDRASYRVNDTLSVLLRDLVLNVAFAQWRSTPFRSDLEPLLNQLDISRDDLEPRLVSFVQATGWDIPT